MTDSSWLLCGGCRRMLYGKRFLRAGRVCPECGWHAPLTAPKRLESLLDTGSVRPIEVVMADSDPLEFTDTKPYRDRLAEARSRTGLDEAVLCARGRIGGPARPGGRRAAVSSWVMMLSGASVAGVANCSGVCECL
jgi:acetyl-CoA carboxylase carboxyl transferase subunit beta